MERIRRFDFYIQMPTPSFVILGVYKLDVPARVYRQQWKVTGSDELTKAHFKNLVLIEVAVEHRSTIVSK